MDELFVRARAVAMDVGARLRTHRPERVLERGPHYPAKPERRVRGMRMEW